MARWRGGWTLSRMPSPTAACSEVCAEESGPVPLARGGDSRTEGNAVTDVDLIVAGAGGGLAGALRAAELGRHVLVVESNEHFLRGNNTAMSTAMIPGAGSRYQRANGVDDSSERFLDDIAAKTDGQAEPVVSRALAEVSAELVGWLADQVGLPIELPTDFSYPGHSVQRLHSVPGRHGSKVLRGLYEKCRAHSNIDFLIPASLVHLHPGWTATMESPDGTRELVTAHGILLATNGYGADQALVSRYLPEIANATYHGSEYSRGDALRMGVELGACTGYLDAYQGHGALSVKARTLVTWTTIMHGAVMVDGTGRRFGDETCGYSEYAATLATRPGSTGWIVLDERIHQLCLAFADYRDAVDSGAIHEGQSVPALAKAIGVDADTLDTELAETALVARGVHKADRFGRQAFEAELGPPFRAVEVTPALFHTQGGLTVDAVGRVLATDGALAGLYASGGAAAGISGHGAAGYLAGNGLLPAFGLAYLAATAFAGQDCPASSGRKV